MDLIADHVAARLERPGAGLLLDLDGTLLDSEPVHRGAFRDYFAGRGWQVEDQMSRGVDFLHLFGCLRKLYKGITLCFL